MPTYWIVDLDARLIEVWTPDSDQPVVCTDVLTWRPDPVVPALELELTAFFAAVLEE